RDRASSSRRYQWGAARVGNPGSARRSGAARARSRGRHGHHSAHLCDIDDRCAEDITIEIDRTGGAGDGEKRCEGRCVVGATVRRVDAREAGCFIHALTLESRWRVALGKSRHDVGCNDYRQRMIDAWRGILYPARMPQFHRISPPEGAAELVEWFWIPEWDIEPGRISRQQVVAYPALHLVVDAGGVALVGATTRASHRDLTGRGWGAGALLKPAAVAALVDDPAVLRDGSTEFDAPELHRAVTQAMDAGGAGGREHAVAAFSAWLVERIGEIG